MLLHVRERSAGAQRCQQNRRALCRATTVPDSSQTGTDPVSAPTSPRTHRPRLEDALGPGAPWTKHPQPQLNTCRAAADAEIT